MSELAISTSTLICAAFAVDVTILALLGWKLVRSKDSGGIYWIKRLFLPVLFLVIGALWFGAFTPLGNLILCEVILFVPLFGLAWNLRSTSGRGKILVGAFLFPFCLMCLYGGFLLFRLYRIVTG